MNNTNQTVKPNFIIPGAQKSGSTTLHYLLKQHPDIFLPDFKEPLYFISDIIKNISNKDIGFKNEGFKDKLIHSYDDYIKLFEVVDNEKAIGEASASYLYYAQSSIPLIKDKLGDPKIIIILRNPVNKIFSQYKHLQREHAENRSFEKALSLEKERIAENYTAMYHYKAQGLYYEPIKLFKENFSNVLVVLTDDLRSDPIAVAQKCYHFLGVKESFIPELKNYNISTIRTKNRTLHGMLYNKKAHSLKMFFKRIFGSLFYENWTKKYKKMNFESMNIKMKEETNIELKKYFKNDIENLENLLSINLSNWK